MKKYKIIEHIKRHLFQAIFVAHRKDLSPKKIDYAQLRLAEKPAVNFLKPAINQKNAA